MRTKNKTSTDKEILQMFLDGKSQDEIFRKLSSQESAPKPKKLLNKIRENQYLSPKNFKYGSVLVFFTAYLSPVFAIYMRGYEYELLLGPVLVLSMILSSPFLIFAFAFFYTKDIRRMHKIGAAFLIYYFIYLITFAAVAIDISLWTIVLFPLVIFPTMLIEWLKLGSLIEEVGRDAIVRS
ncbi:hypothetical protein GF389_02180 [Candidatus Dojkabacteria bacterium]|nr:hypothetical protein [Candidatus Dojkabacteria bacterium]